MGSARTFADVVHYGCKVRWYAPGVLKHRVAQLGITQSMNPPGKVPDSAHIESFFHARKSEVIRDLTFSEDRQIESMLRGYAPFYNPMPRHSPLGYVPPAACEKPPA